MEIINRTKKQIITPKADGYLITDLENDHVTGEVRVSHQLILGLALQSSRSINKLLKDMFR